MGASSYRGRGRTPILFLLVVFFEFIVVKIDVAGNRRSKESQRFQVKGGIIP